MADEITANTDNSNPDPAVTANTETSAQTQTAESDQTAQIPPNEPFSPENPQESESIESEPASKPESAIVDSARPPSSSFPLSDQSSFVISPQSNISKNWLGMARFAIQTRRRKKLEHIMALFAKRTNITNDEVEKLLHISDATATRYLEILEK